MSQGTDETPMICARCGAAVRQLERFGLYQCSRCTYSVAMCSCPTHDTAKPDRPMIPWQVWMYEEGT
jgi:predicted amidophosphoribosyltransferase